MILHSLKIMINKKYLKLKRSYRKTHSDNFIYETIGKRIIDSIDLIKIEFNNILELGINDENTCNFLNEKYPNSSITRADISIFNKNNSSKNNYIEIDLDKWGLDPNNYDLICSNFFLHLSLKFEDLIKNIHLSLKSGGFFIFVIPDVDNIFQLVNSMYQTDLQIYKGAYRRINPTIKIDDILNILKKTNYDLPNIYSDKITIEYSDFNKLLKDLKISNLSYCYQDKKQTFEKKNYFKILEENYKKNYFKKNFVLDLKFNIVSSWKK